MITAGVDCGAKTVKVVIMSDGVTVGTSLVSAGLDTVDAAERAFDGALKLAGLSRSGVQRVVATGAGKVEARFAADSVTEVGADARGGVFLMDEARTIIDVGAEEGRAIRVDAAGKVVDFAINERCAAGAGAFTEAMARALEIPIEEMGPLSLASTGDVAMNAQCAVFAESELVALIHSQAAKPDMARAIHAAIADRIASMVRRVGVEHQIMLIGGVARNVGFVDCLNRELEVQVRIPDEPEYVGATGAALIAAGR
jgi:benzoyl-CoA reductase subunit D